MNYFGALYKKPFSYTHSSSTVFINIFCCCKNSENKKQEDCALILYTDFGDIIAKNITFRWFCFSWLIHRGHHWVLKNLAEKIYSKFYIYNIDLQGIVRREYVLDLCLIWWNRTVFAT